MRWPRSLAWTTVAAAAGATELFLEPQLSLLPLLLLVRMLPELLRRTWRLWRLWSVSPSTSISAQVLLSLLPISLFEPLERPTLASISSSASHVSLPASSFADRVELFSASAISSGCSGDDLLPRQRVVDDELPVLVTGSHVAGELAYGLRVGRQRSTGRSSWRHSGCTWLPTTTMFRLVSAACLEKPGNVCGRVISERPDWLSATGEVALLSFALNCAQHVHSLLDHTTAVSPTKEGMCTGASFVAVTSP